MYLVLGNATIDLFVGGIDALPTMDGDEFTNTSLIFTTKPLTVSIGGNGGNAAFVLGHFGEPTALCSAVGRDTMGDLLVNWLKQKNVCLDALRQFEDDGTSTSTVVADSQMNRLTFHYGEPTFRYRLEHIPPELLHTAEVLLISSYSLFTGVRGDGYQQMLEVSRHNGAITAVDIGPMLGVPASVEELTPLLPLIDYLICNEYELSVCTHEAEREAGISALLRAGARQVVVKRGKQGVIVITPTERFDIAGFPVDAATTTVGAGDSFNAGFLYALKHGQNLEDAATFGCATAALVVSSGQGILGVPTLEAVQALIDAHTGAVRET